MSQYRYILYSYISLVRFKIYLVIGYAHIALNFVFKSRAQKEEESGPKKGAPDKGEAEKEGEEAGEGSTGAHPDR